MAACLAPIMVLPRAHVARQPSVDVRITHLTIELTVNRSCDYFKGMPESHYGLAVCRQYRMSATATNLGTAGRMVEIRGRWSWKGAVYGFDGLAVYLLPGQAKTLSVGILDPKCGDDFKEMRRAARYGFEVVGYNLAEG